MKNFLKENWFKFGVLITIVIIGALITDHYFYSLTKKNDLASQKRIDTRVDDRFLGTEKMRGYFEKNPKAKLDYVVKWLDGEVRKGAVTLSSPKKLSTYKRWAREAGLQPPEAKVRGKDKQPRNAHSKRRGCRQDYSRTGCEGRSARRQGFERTERG